MHTTRFLVDSEDEGQRQPAIFGDGSFTGGLSRWASFAAILTCSLTSEICWLVDGSSMLERLEKTWRE